ncbi:MAG: SpoIIE family protein phosphatase [Syntrophobacteraceae bacterium]|nr:SpoIIE family protein phosphatase [Syntrophobacteraceae bacterium]
MSQPELTRRFDELFAAYFRTPGEAHLSQIAEIGREMVLAQVPPEDLADVFIHSLLNLRQCATESSIFGDVERLVLPLTELLMAYGLEFRERIAMEHARKETRLAREIIEHAAQGIWLSDLDGRISLCNRAFSLITGFAPAEVVGRSIDSLFEGILAADPPETAPGGGSGDGPRRREILGRRKDGVVYPALLGIGPIPDGAGSIRGHVGVLDDLTERKREERLRFELDRAKEIYDLVIRPGLPVIDGLAINVECRPAVSIGGDIIELVGLGRDRVVFLLADVTGHGIPAAMTANTLKTLFREVLKTTRRPGEILDRLNQAMVSTTLPDDMVAAFCGLVDLGAASLEYALAGTPLPMILRNGLPIHLQPTGMPLGMFEDRGYGTGSFDLTRGDIIIAMTDGITEAVSRGGDVFGRDGVMGSLGGEARGAHDVVDVIVSEAARFQGSSVFQDDVIVIALEIGGTSAGGSPAPSWNRFHTDSRCLVAMPTRDIRVDELVRRITRDVSRKVPFDANELNRLKLVVHELLLNAVEHGNLEMTPYKSDPVFYDTEAYRRMLQERLRVPELGGRLVTLEWVYGRGRVEITIADEGKGFDASEAARNDPGEDLFRPTGRGIRLAKMLSSQLTYSGRGNIVTCVVAAR